MPKTISIRLYVIGATAFKVSVARPRFAVSMSRVIIVARHFESSQEATRGLIRFFRRKNPYEEFDKLLGAYRDRRPSAFWLFCHDMKYYAKEFLYSLRRKRRVDIQAPLPVIFSPRIQIEGKRRAGIKDECAKSDERELLWWNSLSPEQQAKVPPIHRPRGCFPEGVCRDDILQWWYSLSPGEQGRVFPDSRPAPIGRDPRPIGNSNDVGKER